MGRLLQLMILFHYFKCCLCLFSLITGDNRALSTYQPKQTKLSLLCMDISWEIIGLYDYSIADLFELFELLTILGFISQKFKHDI